MGSTTQNAAETTGEKNYAFGFPCFKMVGFIQCGLLITGLTIKEMRQCCKMSVLLYY